MAFMCASPHAMRKSHTSLYSASQFALRACVRGITMSISVAPSATHCRISASLCSCVIWPEGKPVATDATGMPVPFSASTASLTRAGYTHTAPTVIPRWLQPIACRMSGRTGDFALAQRRCTLPAVSSPARVVRSMLVTARSSQAACQSFLTVRRPPSSAALRLTELVLIRTDLTQPRSRGRMGGRSRVWPLLGVNCVGVVLAFFAGGIAA
mmetsp:Transcript_43341/g.113916  ORF Transcript_43341/g.113916 Transcript_43341/m.113916 type:complete len:211 (+) Transcript_43341:845-1477(+)